MILRTILVIQPFEAQDHHYLLPIDDTHVCGATLSSTDYFTTSIPTVLVSTASTDEYIENIEHVETLTRFIYLVLPSRIGMGRFVGRQEIRNKPW